MDTASISGETWIAIGTMVFVGAVTLGTWPSQAASEGAASPTCRGERATIVGTPHEYALYGTGKKDVMAARADDDLIVGRRRDDLICGGRRGDTLKGRSGNDRLYGNRGEDDLFGGGGDDDFCDGGPPRPDRANHVDLRGSCERHRSALPLTHGAP